MLLERAGVGVGVGAGVSTAIGLEDFAGEREAAGVLVGGGGDHVTTTVFSVSVWCVTTTVSWTICGAGGAGGVSSVGSGGGGGAAVTVSRTVTGICGGAAVDLGIPPSTFTTEKDARRRMWAAERGNAAVRVVLRSERRRVEDRMLELRLVDQDRDGER